MTTTKLLKQKSKVLTELLLIQNKATFNEPIIKYKNQQLRELNMEILKQQLKEAKEILPILEGIYIRKTNTKYEGSAFLCNVCLKLYGKSAVSKLRQYFINNYPLNTTTPKKLFIENEHQHIWFKDALRMAWLEAEIFELKRFIKINS